MDLDLAILVLFYSFILSLFLIYRKNFRWISGLPTISTTRFNVLFRELSEKYKKPLKVFSYIFILSSILLIAQVHYYLLKGVFELVLYGNTLYRFVPLVPGVKIPTVPFYLPALYGIVGIFLAVIVHEFSHAIIASLHNVKIKSTGLYLLGPLPGAFVELDEEELERKGTKEKVSVAAAGPASNFIFFLLILLVANYIIYPTYSSTFNVNGVVVDEILNNSSVKGILDKGDIIYAINNRTISSAYDVIETLQNYSPGDNVTLVTNKGNFTIMLLSHPENKSRAFIGIRFHTNVLPKKGKETFYYIFSRLYELLKWIGIINYGIALANCLFIGPLDGGRIFYFILEEIIKNEEKRKRIFAYISLTILVLLVFNIVFPFILDFL